MKVQLWTFGKDNKSYVREGISLYSKRLNHYCSFEMKVLSAGKNKGKMDQEALRKQEAAVVLNQLTADHILITLDEKGKMITSPGLAELIEQKQITSSKILVFLIGGAYGTDQSILSRSGKILSLSELTFPHQIVRLIMAEQLYRAFTIIHHEPYHHL